MNYWFIAAAMCRFRFFFFNDTATTEIYTLSLHDALPISTAHGPAVGRASAGTRARPGRPTRSETRDRKSTRLNSSHSQISYAVFCLKKKKNRTHAGEIQGETTHSRADESACTPPRVTR